MIDRRSARFSCKARPLAAVLLLGSGGLTAQPAAPVPVEYLTQAWDGQRWVDRWRGTYHYNERGRRVGVLTDSMAADWVHFRQSIHRFAGDLEVEIIEQVYTSDSGWVNEDRRSFEYDAEGVIVDNRGADYVDGQWVDRWAQTFTNENGLPVEGIVRRVERGVWIPAWRDRAVYDELSRIAFYTSESWIPWEDTWRYAFRREYKYKDESDTVVSLHAFEWDDSTWVNRSLTTTEFGPSLTTELRQRWEDSRWVNRSMIVRELNSQGNPTRAVTERWIVNEWLPEWEKRMIYDESGELEIEQIRSIWDGQRMPEARTLTTYAVVTNVPDEIPGDSELSFEAYPNPASDRAWLVLAPNVFSRPVRVSLHDVTGRRISVHDIDGNRLEMDVSPHARGLYFLHVTTGSRTAVRALTLISSER